MKAIKQTLWAVLLSLLGLSASAQVRVLWDQPISLEPPGHLESGTLIIDSQGNPWLGGSWVHNYDASGYLVSEYLVRKYHPDGSLVWTARHGNPKEDDYAYGFTLDHHDNAVITGLDKAGQTTIKYDPDGALLWTRSTQFGFPQLLTVDNQDNIFVLGGFAVYPSKFAPDGTLLWHQAFLYGSGTSLVRALTDSQGNLFVLSTVLTHTTVYDVELLKYSPGGELLWSWIYDDPLHGWDEARDMALDAQGNVIVTANTDQVYDPSGAGFAAMVTWKLDTDGHILWKSVYGDLSNAAAPKALILDPSSGAVYVAGYASQSPAPLLFKYHPDGSLAWVRPIHVPVTNAYRVDGLRLAPDGFVYALTYVADYIPSKDAFEHERSVLSKFDADGQEHWDDEFMGMTFYEMVFDGGRGYLIGYESVPQPTNFLAHFLRFNVQAVRSEGDVSGPTGQADGIVDDWDITALILAFGSTEVQFDVNGDGKVDETDLGIALKNFGTGVGE